MLKIAAFLLVSVTTTSAWAQEINCVGIYRLFNNDGVLEQLRLDLPVTDKSPSFIRFEAEVKGKALVASVTLHDKDALLTIVKAPDYTNGTNSRSSMSSGYASISSIEEVKDSTPTAYTLHKIECYSR